MEMVAAMLQPLLGRSVLTKVAVALVARLCTAEIKPQCPGTVNVDGFGLAAIVPTGWATPASAADVDVHMGSAIIPHLGSRAYFAQECTGVYNRSQYLAFNLLGKTISYTVDLAGTGCGCNVALYLTSMRQNPHASECFDHYCDSNSVCGHACAEIDIQEGNQYAWHSTLHGKADPGGLGVGYGGGGMGWSGPRQWTSKKYGPGADCIDTNRPFQVAASFPADVLCKLTATQVVLMQVALGGKTCELPLRVGHYDNMDELSKALAAGMTPTVSYWNSKNMLWMDGRGQDGLGPCEEDTPDECGHTARLSNFSIKHIQGCPCTDPLTNQSPANLHRNVAPVKQVPTTTRDMVEVDTSAANRGAKRISGVAAAFTGFFAGGSSMALLFAAFGVVRAKLLQRKVPSVQAEEQKIPALGQLSRSQPSALNLLQMGTSEGQTA
eukprot:CAMPEP_0172860066 /NCGR_PEP_ID=MMETSP1075-20121228/71873_1 /TAXON_ID=2916 /ORGANISM="Ceratium fusus, Strain PA161109" /LENGTH=437 /DNA_ID=CAMNT_0013708049 /DNA_START=37 /DNA_END=1350 /DNA_ORIENTATION=+